MVKAIEDQNRHNTKEEIQKRKLAEEAAWVGNDQLEHSPDWLIDTVAKKEWNRLTKEFAKKSMISNLDYNNLGAYCNAFARYVRVSNELEDDLEVIGTQINPLVNLKLKYSEEIRKFGGSLGLTIQSRVQAGNNNLDEEEEGLSKRMGDI